MKNRSVFSRSSLIRGVVLTIGVVLFESTVAGAAAAAATPWIRVPSPNRGDQSSYLSALAAISPSDVWTVGAWYRPISTPGTLTEHWNGSAWSIVPSPNVTQGYNELYGIAAGSSTDVWAVGYHNIAAYGSEKTMALHWNGSRWSVVPTRNLGPNANFLLAASAVASDDVWAVGLGASTSNEVGRPLIQHWDGARWSLVPNPSLGGAFGILNEVVTLASDDVWTVGSHDGSTLIEHWDGSSWTVVPSPNGPLAESELYAVSAAGPDDLWAVGQSYNFLAGETLAEHWDGAAWTVVPSLDAVPPFTALYGVHALGPNDVWAVGSTYDPVAVDYKTFTQHWNGSTWTVVQSPNPGPLYDQLFDVVGFPGGDVWAAGQAHTDTLVIRTRDR
jgi:hypothetical protein